MQLFKMYSNTGPEFDAWPEASPNCEAFDAGEPMDVDILSEMADQKIIEAANKSQNKDTMRRQLKVLKGKDRRKLNSHTKSDAQDSQQLVSYLKNFN